MIGIRQQTNAITLMEMVFPIFCRSMSQSDILPLSYSGSELVVTSRNVSGIGWNYKEREREN